MQDSSIYVCNTRLSAAGVYYFMICNVFLVDVALLNLVVD
jgi:hypothetical protein